LGLGLNCWAEKGERARGDAGCFGGTCEAAGFLFGGLVEGELDFEGTARRLAVLLLVVDIGDYVIVLHHLESFLSVIM